MSDEQQTQQADDPSGPGWRDVEVGEILQSSDMLSDGTRFVHTDAAGSRCTWQGVYRRRIEQQAEPEPQPERQPQPQPEPQLTPDDPSGPGWRDVEPDELLQDGDMLKNNTGLWLRTSVPGRLAREGWGGTYRRRIEPQPQPQPEPQPESDTELQAQVTFLKNREVTLGTRLQQEREVTTRLRGELESVQNLLGTERQRVTQLEDLVGSLRAINEAQEKAFEAAGKENTDLQHRLNVVATEWAEQAETIRRLQIELDAAQQVPQAIADRFEEGWNQGTARAVEAISEWLEPIRAVDNEHLANETLQHLPQIMRSLTGLAQD